MTKAIARNLAVIENAGPNNLKAFLHDALDDASSADIGVAFITRAGVEHLFDELMAASSRGPVRVLTGLYQSVTEPKALRRLLTLQKKTSGQFAVRLSTDNHFHWKAYFVFHGLRGNMCIGSSNFTEGGLKSSGEMNLTLSLPRKSPEFCRIHGVFESEWQRAVVLSDKIIQAYEKARPGNAGVSSQLNVSLEEVLGTDDEPIQPSSEPAYRRTTVVGYLRDETDEIISDETDWDEKGFGWFAGTAKYMEGDQFVVFDENTKYVSHVVLTKTTELQTPDGRYFAAYRQIRGSHKRKFTPQLWKTLRDGGWVKNRSDAKRERKMRKPKFAELLQFLRLDSN